MNSTITILAISQMWIPVAGIIFGCGVAAVAIIFGVSYAKKEQELWHETARIAIEKGQPVPPGPSEIKSGGKRNDIRVGLILIAVGLGVYLFLYAVVGSRLANVGTIPGLIGVALFGYGIVEAAFKKNRIDSKIG